MTFTYDDEAAIRNSLMTRLHEPGKLEIIDVVIDNMPDEDPPHIRVGVWWILRDRVQEDGLIDGKSYFDLPAHWELIQLHNEVDEIAEAAKKARAEAGIGRLVFNPGVPRERKTIMGNGLRGQWPDREKEPAPR